MAADAIPSSAFEDASARVLDHLAERLPLALWMVTRVDRDDWIVLQARDHGYGVQPGAVERWSESFCIRMVAGQGPHVAPDSRAVEAYASAPIGGRRPIGAYVGMPLSGEDGGLFGTLCGIDPQRQPESLRDEEPLVALLASLLSTVLALELRARDSQRHAERAEHDALVDELTGLYNRRAWERLVIAEERRCARHGHAASVLVLDLDGFKQVNDEHGHAAGDEVLRRVAAAVRAAIRESDVAARLGGDEFGVLAIETHEADAALLAERLRRKLAEDGIHASIGIAARDPRDGLAGAVERADEAMYAAKQHGGGG